MSICSMPKVECCPQFDSYELGYLNSTCDLTVKMFNMADMLSLTREEHCERERIVADIFSMLRPYYPECDVLVFGSSANGFGFRNCDLDLLFLPFSQYCNLDFKDRENSDIPYPSDVLNGTVPCENLYHMTEEMHLSFVHSVMKEHRQYFRKIVFIPAKCPILSIEFAFSHIKCDFSSSNRLVLYNTQLLWLYGKLDIHVKPLVMFLRLWAKSLGFISKSLLSSYCLTLLVIFFLQNTNPELLPSVKYLKELAGYSRIIDGWETAICLDTRYINSNRYENPYSLDELLIQFFDFYWNFDYIQNIVSVSEGEPLPVKQVKESKDERIRNFQVTPFSVQDPFILGRNLSRNSKMKTPFKLSLLIAKNLLHQRAFNFELLFSSTYYKEEMGNMFTSTKRKLMKGSTFLTLQLTHDVCNKLGITSQLKPWFDKICQCVLDVLRYGLLIECEVVDRAEVVNMVDKPPNKKRKFNINNIEDLKPLISIQCIVNFPTLRKRTRTEVLENLKNTDANFEVESSEFEIPASLKTDYVISRELSKNEVKDVTNSTTVDTATPLFSFICNCLQYSESQIPDVVISFAPLTNPIIYNQYIVFLKSFLEKKIKCILEEV